MPCFSEAIERLRIIPSIAGRSSDQQARSLGNIKSFSSAHAAIMYAGSNSWPLILASEWETELPVR